MGTKEAEAELQLQGQADIWKYMFSFADTMAVKCAVELRIPDIINRHGEPITLSQIVAGIPDAHSPDISYLARIMRLLVRRKIFAAHQTSEGGETKYGLTHSFNDGMACTANIVMNTFVSEYKDGLGSVASLVDVGGGTGTAIAEVVKSNPHIKGINFDLPHVVSTAPIYDGVTHVGGDMFQAIPNADAVFMKWIMHDWDDESCVKILKNCRKAIPKETGKVIIVDVVLQPEGGKERTEPEWKKVLEEGGFPRYNIIKIPALPSIIEAFPK